MTARGTVTVTADTLEDARRQTAEAISAFTDRWRVVDEDCQAKPNGGYRIDHKLELVVGWTVTTTWTEEDA